MKRRKKKLEYGEHFVEHKPNGKLALADRLAPVLPASYGTPRQVMRIE